MSDYNQTVGIKLQDDFSDVTAELGKLKQKLNELSGAIDIIAEKATNMISQIKALNKHVEAISTTKLNNKNLNSYYKNLEKIVGKAEELAKKNISSIALINTQNNTVNGTAIDPYGVSRKNITKHIQNVNKVKDTIKNAGKEADKTRKKFASLFSVGRIYFYVNYTKQTFRAIGNWINTAIDYYEIDNLFQNAMGSMYKTAKAYQSKLTDMYGMSTNTMMQAQATYKNMIGNLGGLSEEMSYRLSEIVTNMTLDFSSLYNVDVDKAIAKFQSALSKQVRPIRSTSGMDITQNVLQLTANRLGIDKTITQMNEVEKRMLIILTLAEQMKSANAFKDFSRTIEYPANELRILKEQFIELGKWIGNVLLGIIKDLIPYITAVVMLLKEVFMWISTIFNFNFLEKSDTTGTVMDDISDAEDSADNIANSFGSAANSAKDIKKSLAGFDQLNIISKPNESSNGGGGIGTGTIDPAILKALQDLDYSLANVETRASKIKDTFKAWVINIKETTLEKLQGLFDYMAINKNSIIAVISAISGLFIGKKIADFFTNFNLDDFLLKLGVALEKMKLNNLAEFIIDLPSKFKTAFDKIKPLVTKFAQFFKNPIKTITSLLNGIPKAISSAFTFLSTPAGIATAAIGLVVAGITYCLATSEEFREDFLETFGDIAEELGKIIGLICETIGNIRKKYLQPLLTWAIETFGPLFGDVFTFVGECVLIVLRAFEGLLDFISTLFTEGWAAAFQGLFDTGFGLLEDLISGAVDLFIGFLTWLGEKFIGPIADWFSSIFDIFGGGADDAVDEATEAFGDLQNYLDENELQANVKVNTDQKSLSGAVSSVKSAFSGIKFNIKGAGAAAGIAGALGSLFISQYGTGGFPNVGEMFIARENGPELVGTMGGRNVVANNQQIEEGIAKASYSGMKQALKETNANQGGDVYVQNTVKIGDETISKTIKKANKDEILKTGEPIFEESW